MKIYSSKGDNGKTSIIAGEKVLKDSTVIETIGNIDELNAMIGLNMSICNHHEIRNILSTVQTSLFNIGSEIASHKVQQNDNIIKVSHKEIQTLENQIDTINSRMPELKEFIYFDSSFLACNLNVARTICRKAERVMTRFLAKNKMETYMLVYLNRLSDLLFVLARYANMLEDDHQNI